MKPRPWFWRQTGHDGYVLAQLKFTEANARWLLNFPLESMLDEYSEVTQSPLRARYPEWMEGDRFFLAKDVLRRLEISPVSCGSQISLRGTTLEFYHSMIESTDGINETLLMMHLAKHSELQMLSWRFEVGCRSVHVWAQGKDNLSLIKHLAV